MSTFDGLVDEFPNIRIDYFRHQADRTPPQACFLSHVHSDHLQGLETLKMPFVYCSVATKQILLRMEKYPHRINFAKGILEARKQTYKALKLVLRALPLEVPVELELDPKSKLRVTLFDANHCPGAVMFLIEGHDKAVLYTGDLRAEPWWVNSITRNPIMLPYTCGMKRLDCVYLDTTFASHDDVYQRFPTKADGLKELLAKVSKCPKSSLFYFRSWTLGYEDVWIALSSFLQSQIHVDDYQLRIFQSLANEANVTDRGPALAGFNHGNQRQLGCLTDDSSASIHSCEPGTDCHDQIKKRKNVVWILPIVSRLENGTEVAEVGAGGGGGDLYQTPQLETIDEPTFQALEKLCAESEQHREALLQLGQAFSAAIAKGDTGISLEGLNLDQDEEITLKQFVQLISTRDKSSRETSIPIDERVIRFPYSRHSSFSELRHLISSFQPKDICPCTVDLETWTEEVSMQCLFGDLCSGDTFEHDRKSRSIVNERRQAIQGKKRKRIEEPEQDSQRTETQQSRNAEEVFTSAKTSMRKSGETNGSQKQASAGKTSTQTPTPVRRLHRTLSGKFEAEDTDPTRSATTAVAPIAVESHSDDSQRPNNPEHNPPQPHLNLDEEPSSDSDFSPSPSTFSFQDQTATPAQQARKANRIAAYRAAKAVLDNSDYGLWQDLRVRSLGFKGHTDVEEEL